MLVLIETPYVESIRHLAYVRDALRDSHRRGEVPLSGQSALRLAGAFDSADEAVETAAAHRELFDFTRKTVVYADLGISDTMRRSIRLARAYNRLVEYRFLPKWVCGCVEHPLLGLRILPSCSRHGSSPSFDA